MKHKGTKTLTTSRLILRAFNIDDITPSYKNWTTDQKTCEYLRWQPHPDKQTTQNIIQQWINQYNQHSFYQWAIIYQNEPIGTISTVSIDETVKKVHIGYCLGSKWWNKGIMSEALDCVIQFFFDEVGVKRIESQCDPRNIGSYRVMEKCGLLYEGTLRGNDYNNKGIVDAKVYGLLESDYYIRNGIDYLQEVKQLIVEYYKELNRDLSFQNIDDELKDLSKYIAPLGEVYVYIKDNEVRGIIAYHKHSDTRCEMKRLFVKKEYRNEGIGKLLIDKIISCAKKAQYKEMVLDTIEPLQAALHLYTSFNFIPCEAYYHNPMDDVIYMKKEL